MTANPHHQRSQRYFHLSTRLTQLDNQQLAALLASDSAPQDGWGSHQTVMLDNTKLFIKRVPLTAFELQHSFSTENLYQLPPFYHYGIGSAGFGVYRELVAHIKTTNWVLSGAIANFPLLYHYRVLPMSGERPAMDMERHQRYVTYWGSNEQIGQYMLARANADHEMVFVLEHIPHTLAPWLGEHADQIGWVLDDLAQTVNFLRQHAIIHFDAHFHNVLTDGERVYLTDFGLVLDKAFALQADELAFFERHQDYDHGQTIGNLIYYLYDRFEALPEELQQELRARFEAPEPRAHFHKLVRALFDNLATLQAEGIINVDDTFCAQLTNYRTILLLISGFFAELQGNPAKDTPFPQEALQQLLIEAGVITLQD